MAKATAVEDTPVGGYTGHPAVDCLGNSGVNVLPAVDTVHGKILADLANG